MEILRDYKVVLIAIANSYDGIIFMRNKNAAKPLVEKNNVERMFYKLLLGGIGRNVNMDGTAHYNGLKIGQISEPCFTRVGILLIIY